MEGITILNMYVCSNFSLVNCICAFCVAIFGILFSLYAPKVIDEIKVRKVIRIVGVSFFLTLIV